MFNYYDQFNPENVQIIIYDPMPCSIEHQSWFQQLGKAWGGGCLNWRALSRVDHQQRSNKIRQRPWFIYVQVRPCFQLPPPSVNSLGPHVLFLHQFLQWLLLLHLPPIIHIVVKNEQMREMLARWDDNTRSPTLCCCDVSVEPLIVNGSKFVRPGHVVTVSLLCCDGVPVVLWRCPGRVVTVSRSCCDTVPVMLWRCPGPVMLVSRSYCEGHILMMYWTCCDGISACFDYAPIMLWWNFGHVVTVSW